MEIEVRAAGLNFRDVLVALGVVEQDHGGSLVLGGECAGVVTAVGPGVIGLAVGDAVVAVAPWSFARVVVAPAAFVVPIPAGLAFEDAATLPLAFMTALYALEHVGRLAAGERVLIHAAAGGVGLAAVQLAQRCGAEVIATAGSPRKRAVLAARGVRHVFDSRPRYARSPRGAASTWCSTRSRARR